MIWALKNALEWINSKPCIYILAATCAAALNVKLGGRCKADPPGVFGGQSGSETEGGKESRE